MPTGVYKRSKEIIEKMRERMINNSIKRGKKSWNSGKIGVQKVTLETKKKLSELRHGNKYAKGTIHTDKWKEEQSLRLKEEWKKGKRSAKHLLGKNHWNWKGGVSPINKTIRGTKEYKLWRESVFIRDNYTCIWCGKRGCYLEADHIKPFASYPELRFAIDNGRTLCLDCHKTTDNYFWKSSKNVHFDDSNKEADTTQETD